MAMERIKSTFATFAVGGAGTDDDVDLRRRYSSSLCRRHRKVNPTMVVLLPTLLFTLTILVGTTVSTAAAASSSAGATTSASAPSSSTKSVTFIKNQRLDDDHDRSNIGNFSISSMKKSATSSSSSSTPPPSQPYDQQHPRPRPDVDWDSFGFSLNGVQTNAMWVDRVNVVFDDNTEEEEDDEGNDSDSDSAGAGTSINKFFGVRPPRGLYSCNVDSCLVDLNASADTGKTMMISLSPAATCLNYGQALFEGIKAFRRSDGTTIGIFRPEMNAKRMQDGASRFLLPPVPTDIFLKALAATIRANAEWVPPYGRGALYVRPILLGTGAGLGVGPSSEATFCIYASPVGNYFKGALKCIRLLAVKGFSRAAPNGGVGSIKASGNYAPAFLAQRWVRQVKGYDEVLCLDASTNEAVEEAGASNIFAYYRHNNTLVTPCTSPSTILPGVTRSSIIEIAAAEYGCTIEERPRFLLKDIAMADEAFCVGTGASVTPIGSISVSNINDDDDDDDGNKNRNGDDDGERSTIKEAQSDERRIESPPTTKTIVFGDGTTPGPMTQRLYETLLAIQTGTDEELNERYKDWIYVVDPQCPPPKKKHYNLSTKTNRQTNKLNLVFYEEELNMSNHKVWFVVNIV